MYPKQVKYGNEKSDKNPIIRDLALSGNKLYILFLSPNALLVY